MTYQELKIFNDLLDSWVVQAAIAGLFVALVVVAFALSSRTFEDRRTRLIFRIDVVLLGAALVLQAVATAWLGHTPFPPIPQLIEFIWLIALWLYYFFRLLTRQRSGRGDAETRRRGVALDDALARYDTEAHGTPGAPTP